MSKRLGIIRHSYIKPVYNGLSRVLPDSPARFEFIQDVAPRLVQKLLQGELDGAFLSPIEYAKNYTRLRIVPGICVASIEANHTIEMHFSDYLKAIESLAVNPEFSSEIVLAKIILSEKYNAAPQYIPLPIINNSALEKANAALAIGDECEQWFNHENMIDLVEEWIDTTDLPYVHGIWVTREGALTEGEIDEISRAVAIEDEQPIEFTFHLNETTIAGLEEFFKMCYYHGILEEVPELNFTGEQES